MDIICVHDIVGYQRTCDYTLDTPGYNNLLVPKIGKVYQADPRPACLVFANLSRLEVDHGKHLSSFEYGQEFAVGGIHA